MTGEFQFVGDDDLRSRYTMHPEAFLPFARRLAQYEVLSELGSEKRQQIADILGVDKDQLEQQPRDRILDVLGSQLTRSEDHGIDLIHEAISSNRSAAIEVDGQLASFGGYMDWVLPGLPPITLNGRRIFMITKTATLPDVAGSGMFSGLIGKKLIEKAKAEDPNAYILVITQNRGIKIQCRRAGFEPSSSICDLLDRCDGSQWANDAQYQNAYLAKYNGYKGLDKKVTTDKKGREVGKYEAFLLDLKMV